MTGREIRQSGSRTLHPTAIDFDLGEMGSLSADRSAWVTEHVRVCADCAAELKVLQESRARFSEHVFGRTVVQMRERVRERVVPRPWWRLHRIWRFSPLLVAPVALLLFLQVFPRVAPPSVPGDDSGLRTKGVGTAAAPNLVVYAREQTEVFPLSESRHTLPPGTELRFVVGRVGLPYVMVASIDGAGHASVYYPYQGQRSAEMPRDPGGVLALPGSIVLDASAGPERVFAFFSAEPLDAAAVRQALVRVGQGGWDAIRGQGPLPVRAQVQTSQLIEKRLAVGPTP